MSLLIAPASKIVAPISFISSPGNLPRVGTGRRRTQNIPALHRCMSSMARASMDQQRGLKQLGFHDFTQGMTQGSNHGNCKDLWGFMGGWDVYCGHEYVKRHWTILGHMASSQWADLLLRIPWQSLHMLQQHVQTGSNIQKRSIKNTLSP